MVNKKRLGIIALLLAMVMTLTACGGIINDGTLTDKPIETVIENTGGYLPGTPQDVIDDQQGTSTSAVASTQELASVEFSDSPYIIVNDNLPYFTDAEKERTMAFETYSELDKLGRCGPAYANICQELMPTEERGEIGMIKPSGWHTIKFSFVDGKYLYNRCHLIGFQLAGENANEKNLVTGTRYMNVIGMLPFENEVADYVHETNNHVLYRVTPIYATETDLVAKGVEMEAWSVEDGGEGVCFNVFCFNAQPGVSIDYATGDAVEDGSIQEETEEPIEITPQDPNAQLYVVNARSMKFHYPTCSSVNDIAEYNRHELTTTREDLIADGYSPCGVCKP